MRTCAALLRGDEKWECFSTRHQKVVGQSSLIRFCLSVWGSALPLSSFTSFTFAAPRATSAPPRCCFGCCTIWGVCRNSRGDLPSSPTITESSQLPARTEQGTLIIMCTDDDTNTFYLQPNAFCCREIIKLTRPQK